MEGVVMAVVVAVVEVVASLFLGYQIGVVGDVAVKADLAAVVGMIEETEEGLSRAIMSEKADQGRELEAVSTILVGVEAAVRIEGVESGLDCAVNRRQWPIPSHPSQELKDLLGGHKMKLV
eukprot:Filipodium_phascolosomae@DN3745_c0_g1_i1.p2